MEWHEKLEREIVDRASVHKTLDALAGICMLKADHIRENWQDASLARKWERAGRLIDKLSIAIRKIGV